MAKFLLVVFVLLGCAKNDNQSASQTFETEQISKENYITIYFSDSSGKKCRHQKDASSFTDSLSSYNFPILNTPPEQFQDIDSYGDCKENQIQFIETEFSKIDDQSELSLGWISNILGILSHDGLQESAGFSPTCSIVIGCAVFIADTYDL